MIKREVKAKFKLSYSGINLNFIHGGFRKWKKDSEMVWKQSAIFPC